MHRPNCLLMAVALMMPSMMNDSQASDHEAEGEARRAIEAFMTAWNTGEDVNLRKTMHFPFVSFFGGTRVSIAQKPEDFSQGFDRMREREGWVRSTFDLDTIEIHLSSPEKVHCELDFSRYKADGTRYMTGRVMYIITKREGKWGVQLRTQGSRAEPLEGERRAEVLVGARQAVLDFMEAFNAGDAEGTTRALNFPHLFMTMGGGFSPAEDSGHAAEPDQPDPGRRPRAHLPPPGRHRPRHA